ncbi:hypothetical protein NODU109028_02615 [Nocardioides dubius]
MHRFASDRRPPATGAGWASASLDHTLRGVLLMGNVWWHLLMVTVTIGTVGDTRVMAVLAGCHALAAGLFVAARAGRFPASVALALTWILFVADWAVEDSVDGALLFAACWSANLAAATPAFALRGRVAIWLPVAASLVMPPAMVLIHPDWNSVLPYAVAVTTLSILGGTRVGVSFLWDFAERVDAESSAAAAQARGLVAVRAASAEAAENARILHDTVINTMAAIASGGRGLRDTDAVRRRCARDVETVEDLEAGRPALQIGVLDKGDTVPGTDVRIRRVGLAGSALNRELADLPPAVQRAVSGAVDELLQNAAKHADVDEVVLEVRTDAQEFVVIVADDGRGFEGELPGDRGFARSVRARAESAGIDVVLTTAPGAGTAVALTHRRGTAPREKEPGSTGVAFSGVIRGLRVRAAWLYSVGLAAIGLVLCLSNHGGAWTPEYLMVAVLLLGSGLAWLEVRRAGRHRVGAVGVVVLALAAIVAFLLAAWSVDFGRENVVVWQAIGCTGPLVLLLALRRTQRAFQFGCALLVLTALTVAGLVGVESPEAAAVVVVAAAAALGLAIGWSLFHRTLGTIAAKVLREHRVAETARADTAKVEAAAAARQRWRSAGLQDVLMLLRGIATGQLDPADRAVRQACGDEESYLRQLIQLDPALVRMGDWYAQALRQARVRGVRLALRSGEVEPADDKTAAELGMEILRAVDTVESDEELTITLYPAGDGLRLTMVAPHPRLVPEATRWSLPEHADVAFLALGDQDMIEVMLRAERGMRWGLDQLDTGSEWKAGAA